MEGTLWKWTNYFTGWQPRWFVLDSGILSYFRSQDDVINGCKGSIKMSVCDVIVHPTDSTRLDLIIPGEAHFYVKSATPQERQQWLVALGSCKACLTNGNVTSTNGLVLADIPEDELRGKRSELRLYCDLLMQQVHTVKDAVRDKHSPDLQKLDESTSLLTATCDTFITTLDDCMRLTHANPAAYPAPPSPLAMDSTLPPSPSRRLSAGVKQIGTPFPQLHRSASVDSRSPVNTNPVHIPETPDEDIVIGYIPSNVRGQRSQRSGGKSGSRSRTPSESSELSVADLKTEKSSSTPQFVSDHPVGGLVQEEVLQIPTFFTDMSTSFMDIRLKEDGGIPTNPFLEACRPVLSVFDKLNSTAFAPVKLDVAGNIRKIQQKSQTNPEQFTTLQAMLEYEIDHRQTHLSHSVTIALLWLSRALMFIREFLYEVMTSSEDLEAAANVAYTKTLKRFHGLVVRGVVALAAKAIPYRKDFIAHMASTPQALDNPDFEKKLLQDIENYITALDVVIRILTDFYRDKGLETDEQV